MSIFPTWVEPVNVIFRTWKKSIIENYFQPLWCTVTHNLRHMRTNSLRTQTSHIKTITKTLLIQAQQNNGCGFQNRRTHFFNQRLQIRDLVITCGHTKVDTYTYLVAFHHCSADFNSIAHHHIQNTLAWATSFLSKVCFHNRTKHERIADTQNKRRWNNWIWRTNRRDARLKRKLSGSQSRQRRKLCWFDNYGAACR